MFIIEDEIFLGCSNLAEIIFEGSVLDWESKHKGADWVKGVIAEKVICSDGEVDLR